MFATGIENSYPTIMWEGKRFRVDEMEKSGHYQRFQEDFGLVKDMGISFLRYGPPYYKTHTGPGRYDWAFTDAAMNELRALNITPIIDLCHFGVPDWIESFQNPDWPAHFAEYAKAFATRYPHVQLYTPVNEIYVAATFSSQFGWWNEMKASDRDFVTSLKTLCKANVLAMLSILEVRPDATFIQSESSEYFHPDSPESRAKADFYNQKRFLSLDLSYGHPVDVNMYKYLIANGMTDEEYNWFDQQYIKARCIMGNDYYITNEHRVRANGDIIPSGEIFGYYTITRQYYQRYRLPVMHTETNIADPDAVRWLWKEWANIYRFKQDLFPIVGFTWYSLIDQVDWDTSLRENNNRVNPLGLYDMDRKIRPVGVAYKKLIEEWKPVLHDESYGLHVHF